MSIFDPLDGNAPGECRRNGFTGAMLAETARKGDRTSLTGSAMFDNASVARPESEQGS
jgi:hypothetical protein